MKRNPAWTEEELTLALFVLRRIGDEPLSSGDPRVQWLSELLSELPIHPLETRGTPFRDPDGVRRRLTYLQQFERGEAIPGHEAYRSVLERYADAAAHLEADVNRVLEGYGVSFAALQRLVGKGM